MICVSDLDKYNASYSALWEHLLLLELQSVSWFELAARKNFSAPPTVVASKQLFNARYIWTAIATSI